MKELGSKGEVFKVIQGERFVSLDVHGGRLTAVSTHIEAARKRNRDRIAAERHKKMPYRK